MTYQKRTTSPLNGTGLDLEVRLHPRLATLSRLDSLQHATSLGVRKKIAFASTRRPVS